MGQTGSKAGGQKVSRNRNAQALTGYGETRIKNFKHTREKEGGKIERRNNWKPTLGMLRQRPGQHKSRPGWRKEGSGTREKGAKKVKKKGSQPWTSQSTGGGRNRKEGRWGSFRLEGARTNGRRPATGVDTNEMQKKSDTRVCCWGGKKEIARDHQKLGNRQKGGGSTNAADKNEACREHLATTGTFEGRSPP